MLWDDDDDSEDWQRLKNMAFLNMPVKNETRDEAMPMVGCMMLVLILGAIIAATVS